MIKVQKNFSYRCIELDKIKRMVDIIGSLTGLIIFSPIFLGVSYLIYKEDKGPVFFVQERSGKDNISFKIYKFRSMKVDNKIIGDSVSPYEKWKDKVPDDFIFKTAENNNPNITKIGSFIRKTSIDELPQLYNVLIGNMSLIGPRPEIIEITKKYDSEQLRRLEVKPGITGWAQVNGRSDINHGQKIKYDLEYIDNRNLKLEIEIFIKTIVQVLKKKGSV
ncbi:sugar transferase [Macrococcus bovicus]|uniref:sugar transferase n=1 Tax=Macrococcus bovicus TaxID=69968 RepID=UPI0025A5FC65|nr:sugar transferase [Macrococcus bovicus]WJP98489.1 sugar transferase [Macrococcus bovicus]